VDGATYLYEIEESPDGFTVGFFADSAFWCDGAPYQGVNRGETDGDLILRITGETAACRGEPVFDNQEFTTELILDLATGKLVDPGGLLYERTDDIDPGDLFPGA
jgi:hypothetical protein